MCYHIGFCSFKIIFQGLDKYRLGDFEVLIKAGWHDCFRHHLWVSLWDRWWNLPQWGDTRESNPPISSSLPQAHGCASEKQLSLDMGSGVTRLAVQRLRRKRSYSHPLLPFFLRSLSRFLSVRSAFLLSPSWWQQTLVSTFHLPHSSPESSCIRIGLTWARNSSFLQLRQWNLHESPYLIQVGPNGIHRCWFYCK